MCVWFCLGFLCELWFLLTCPGKFFKVPVILSLTHDDARWLLSAPNTEREQEISFPQKITSVNAAYVTCCWLSFRAQDGWRSAHTLDLFSTVSFTLEVNLKKTLSGSKRCANVGQDLMFRCSDDYKSGLGFIYSPDLFLNKGLVP